jgi:formylglycine-generating enzyme required for sulfatase activity
MYNLVKKATSYFRHQITPVDSFPTNAFGLYDMHANRWEWCHDIYHDNYQDAPNNGSADKIYRFILRQKY